MNNYLKLGFKSLMFQWDKVKYPLEEYEQIKVAVDLAIKCKDFRITKEVYTESYRQCKKYNILPNFEKSPVFMQPYHFIAVGLSFPQYKRAWSIESKLYFELRFTEKSSMFNGVRVTPLVIVEYDLHEQSRFIIYKFLRISKSYFRCADKHILSLLPVDYRQMHQKLAYKLVDIEFPEMEQLYAGTKVKMKLGSAQYWNNILVDAADRKNVHISLLNMFNNKQTLFLWFYNLIQSYSTEIELLTKGVQTHNIGRGKTFFTKYQYFLKKALTSPR